MAQEFFSDGTPCPEGYDGSIQFAWFQPMLDRVLDVHPEFRAILREDIDPTHRIPFTLSENLGQMALLLMDPDRCARRPKTNQWKLDFGQWLREAGLTKEGC